MIFTHVHSNDDEFIGCILFLLHYWVSGYILYTNGTGKFKIKTDAGQNRDF